MVEKPHLEEKTEEKDIPEGELSTDKGSDSPPIKRIISSVTHFFRNPKVQRIGMLVVTFFVVVMIVWGVGILIVKGTENPPESDLLPTSAPVALPSGVSTPEFSTEGQVDGLIRLPEMLVNFTPVVETRYEVTTYIVEQGDTIFSIAEKFGLAAETVLWSNRYTLGDTPDGLFIGIELYILPVDGVYHRWSEGEGLNGVADYYGVNPEVIVNYPGNNLDPDTIGDYANPNIDPGMMLVVQGGKRDTTTWISARDEEATGNSYLGDGACTVSIYSQSGTGTFTWPTTATWLSGYDYTPPTHNGLDFDGDFGSPIYASDAGVIVYSGWSVAGYGNLIVIDHDNGWQTFYAHLMDGTFLACGTNVQKGELIAAMGSTGNSTGPHLHFELRLYGAAVNPWQYLQ